jgi:GTP-binding protein HflX
VGFIRKLPHGLVEAFKATLEEVVRADLLLHVVDLSHPQPDEQITAVNTVLEEIEADGKPTLMIFNKTDRVESRDRLFGFLDRYPNAVGVSAKTGAGFEALLEQLGLLMRPTRELVVLAVPHEAAAVMARLHQVAQVLERDYSGEMARFKARIPPHLREEFAPYITGDSSVTGGNRN